MPKIFQREIDRLKKEILVLSAIVEESVQNAVRSIASRDSKMAQKVIEADAEIDQMEVDLEESCLKVLALHQPVAIDLRFIVAVLKINNDLERIGDLAVNIAQRAGFLAVRPKVNIRLNLTEMAEKVQAMLHKSLDALINMDPVLAKSVCASDDAIDEMHEDMYKVVEDAIREKPEEIDTLIQLLSVSRQLERIADHATNIAEDVIYMVTGVISRHRRGELRPDAEMKS
jgi:phosphate transport system protein